MDDRFRFYVLCFLAKFGYASWTEETLNIGKFVIICVSIAIWTEAWLAIKRLVDELIDKVFK